MKISHKITNLSGEEIVYIYVTVEDIYEFGKENLGKGENSDFLTKLRSYVNNNLESVKKAAAIIVINAGIQRVIVRTSKNDYICVDVNDWINNDEILKGKITY